MQMAKPLAKPVVDKGRVWGILIGGAVVLFLTTLVAENNETYFPAISRANKAMEMSKKQASVSGPCLNAENDRMLDAWLFRLAL